MRSFQVAGALLVVVVTLVFWRSPPVLAADPVVHFPDANLEAAIRDAIGKQTGDISKSDLQGLTELKANERGISVLTGLEYCTNLTWLELGGNQIEDISPVAELASLAYLYLQRNQIVDIAPVAGLTNLTKLYLEDNRIGDVSALSGLTGLTSLNLSKNQVVDVSALSELVRLWDLYLESNQVSDISALSGLTHLAYLQIHDNQVSDISALSALTNLVEIYLGDNQISDISPLAGLSNLTWLVLSNNQVDDISALEGLSDLTWLMLERNQIDDISALSRLTKLTTLDLAHNQVRDISALAGIVTNLTYLNLDNNPIDDYSVLVGSTDPVVQIPDANLKAAIRDAIDKPKGDILRSDLQGMYALFAEARGISDLTGLEYCVNLAWLHLNSNAIGDISALAGLTSLTRLSLAGNPRIGEVSPLAGLTNLTSLALNNTGLSEISPLAGLTKLTYLALVHNQISDISPLAGLVNLRELYLESNLIRDISALSGLTSLTSVTLNDNPVEDNSTPAAATATRFDGVSAALPDAPEDDTDILAALLIVVVVVATLMTVTVMLLRRSARRWGLVQLEKRKIIRAIDEALGEGDADILPGSIRLAWWRSGRIPMVLASVIGVIVFSWAVSVALLRVLDAESTNGIEELAASTPDSNLLTAFSTDDPTSAASDTETKADYAIPLEETILAALWNETAEPIRDGESPLFSSWVQVRPSIDGRLSSDEWSDASKIPFVLALPEERHGLLYVKNDDENLYLMIIIQSVRSGGWLGVQFDNVVDGNEWELGDDFVMVRVQGDTGSYYDGYARGDGGWGPDTNLTTVPGDGEGAATQTRQSGTDYYIFEIRKPLDTTDDTHDFSLSPGDQVGLLLHYNEATGSAFWPAGGPATRGLSSTSAQLVLAKNALSLDLDKSITADSGVTSTRTEALDGNLLILRMRRVTARLGDFDEVFGD